MTVPTSNITMTNLNTVFAKGFSLSKYYGTTFSSGSAPASGTISYSMFSGKSPPAPFDPTSLSAPLITWFKGDSGLTTSSWTNYGTNTGSNATFIGTGLSIQTVNGLSAIRLSNSGYPNTPSCYGKYFQSFSGQPRAFFIVMRLNVEPTQAPIVMIPQTNIGYSFHLFGSPAAPYEMFLNNHGGEPRVISDMDDSISALTVKLYSTVNSAIAGNNRCYVNGVEHGRQAKWDLIASNYTTGTNTTIDTWIGSDNIGAGATNQDCTVCEILVYDGEVSATDAANVNTYLKTKWGIA